MKRRFFFSAAVICAAIFALAGCDLFPSEVHFEKDGLEQVRPYILEKTNYTVTNTAMGIKLAIKTYVTDTCILINSFKRYDYYVTVGNKLYTFFRMDHGTTSEPEVETQNTRASLTEAFTDCFQMDWVWDEESQYYRSGNYKLVIEETSVSVDLGWTGYLFEDIGRTSIFVPHVIYI